MSDNTEEEMTEHRDSAGFFVNVEQMRRRIAGLENEIAYLSDAKMRLEAATPEWDALEERHRARDFLDDLVKGYLVANGLIAVAAGIYGEFDQHYVHEHLTAPCPICETEDDDREVTPGGF